MKTFFCVMARPNFGFAEMMVEAFDTREDAETCRAAKEERYPNWWFRIATHCRKD